VIGNVGTGALAYGGSDPLPDFDSVLDKGGPAVLLDEGLQDLDVKVVAGITIAHKPTIVICEVPEGVKAGLYYIQNINDVIIVQQIWVASVFVEYDGNGRIELVVMNLVDEWFHIKTDFAIAKLLSAKAIG